MIITISHDWTIGLSIGRSFREAQNFQKQSKNLPIDFPES